MRESKFVGQSVDSQELERYQATLAQLEQRMSSFKPVSDRITQEETDLKRSRENLFQKKKDLQVIVSGPRVTKSRLDQKRLQLQNLNKDTVDLVAEERLVKEKCGVRVTSRYISVFGTNDCTRYL